MWKIYPIQFGESCFQNGESNHIEGYCYLWNWCWFSSVFFLRFSFYFRLLFESNNYSQKIQFTLRSAILEDWFVKIGRLISNIKRKISYGLYQCGGIWCNMITLLIWGDIIFFIEWLIWEIYQKIDFWSEKIFVSGG